MSERPDWCEIHQCSMEGREGKYGFFYSHKTEDPKYQIQKGFCQGKPPRAPKPQGGGPVNADLDARAKAPAQFFATLREWHDYVFHGKFPGAEQHQPQTFDPMEPAAELGYPQEQEEVPF